MQVRIFGKSINLKQAISASPFLQGLVAADPQFVNDLAEADPSQLLQQIHAQCQAQMQNLAPDDMAKSLRVLRAKAALIFALADILDVWTQPQVTQALTDFADVAVRAALECLLREQQRAGKFSHTIQSSLLQSHCGYVILAMGKHGAGELNYSSDIDLIVLYDAQSPALTSIAEPARFCVKLTQQLVALLQNTTEEGYVFRVDLRLRPDPRATQVAIEIESAATYYENMGQNWERAAMIKARPVAGDLALGEQFLARLKPYIWRRYLDFAAIADVQSLKRQIRDVKGHATIAIEGHNLKLGRGGIRDIEFFAQTQQLIAGGKNPALRVPRTVDALHALAEAGWISQHAATELTQCYWVLRKLEHRVQMLNDRQDHNLPKDSAALHDFALFCGFESRDALASALRTTLETVVRHDLSLFEESKELSSTRGSLVFTGGEDDPATLETLGNLGFTQASEISATIRGWHFGRYSATRSKTVRELLTELMPQLLEAFGASGDPDRAIFAFDGFLKHIPSGVQLLSMLKANPQLLELVARVLGLAPRLTSLLSAQPRILEALLEPSFFGPLPTTDELHLQLLHQQVTSLEETMDRLRIFAREQKFRVSVRMLSESLSAIEAGATFSNVAEVAVAALLEAVETEMRTRHGTINGGACAIVAFGKLGGREMTATSDLDLMLVYDFDETSGPSDGERPLAPSQYFARLAQRLVTALTVQTAEGGLYDVDMRLRPSGSKGPVAVSLASFAGYQKDSAWTWEKMALTRARVIAGDKALAAKLDAAITTALAEPRDANTVIADVRTMRNLMLREHGEGGLWDIKAKRGGLVEVEFIAQTLQLLSSPHIAAQNTQYALERLRESGQLTPEDAGQLLEAHEFYARLSHMLRLCVAGPFRPEAATPALQRAIARTANLPDLHTTAAELAAISARVTQIFDHLIGR